MRTKKLVSENVKRAENPFIPETMSRKQAIAKMKEVNENKKSIMNELKEERSFFGCIRYINKNANRIDINTFFQSINSTFHTDCALSDGTIKNSQIEYFNSIKSAKLVETETLKPKKSFSVNYIIEVFRADFKSTLNSKVTKVTKVDAAAKIAKLQAEIAKLSKVA